MEVEEGDILIEVKPEMEINIQLFLLWGGFLIIWVSVEVIVVIVVGREMGLEEIGLFTSIEK